LYLAGDQGVAIAEFARHVAPRPAAVYQPLRRRFIFEIHVHFTSVLDLREAAVCAEYGVGPDPIWIRDIDATRHIATELRTHAETQAVIVPSIAFLDDVRRWNMVVFADTLSSWPAPFVIPNRIVGEIDPAVLFRVQFSDQPHE
jgi:hypothetical protein